jgi:hypothetical protein
MRESPDLNCAFYRSGHGFDRKATLSGFCQTLSPLLFSGGNKADTTVWRMVGSQYRQKFDNIAPGV